MNTLVWKAEGKRPLGRTGHRLKDNIKMDKKRWYVGVGWTHLFKTDHSEGLCEHGGTEPFDSIKDG